MRASRLTFFYTSSSVSIFFFILPSFTYTLTPCNNVSFPSPLLLVFNIVIPLWHFILLPLIRLLPLFLLLFFLLLYLFRAGKFCFSSSLCILPLYPLCSQLVVSNVLHPSHLPVVKGHNLWYLVKGWMCRERPDRQCT